VGEKTEFIFSRWLRVFVLLQSVELLPVFHFHFTFFSRSILIFYLFLFQIRVNRRRAEHANVLPTGGQKRENGARIEPIKERKLLRPQLNQIERECKTNVPCVSFPAVVVDRFATDVGPVSNQCCDTTSNDFRNKGGNLLLFFSHHDILMIGMAWENTLLASRILPPAYTPIEVATNRSQDASLMLEQGTANVK
jgi:hypothetical protein